MTITNGTRTHLVERAVARMGGAGAIQHDAPIIDEPSAEPPPPPPKPSRPQRPIVDVTPHPPIAHDRLLAAGMVAPKGPGRSRVLEEIAMVQHQVLRQVDAATEAALPHARVVLVASALPNEGKSFVALNLAASIAASGGRPVLLVDADGRIDSVSHALGAADAPGLRDLAAEPTRQVAELALPTAQERLEFLSYGRPSAADKELPSGSAMAAAISVLTVALPDHIIVLDPPPCLSTSDCSALAAIAGQVVLVVDAERTARNEVEAALDVLESCPTLQLLLNRVRLTANDTFGAYGEYGVPHAG